jgi:hypothetical protein
LAKSLNGETTPKFLAKAPLFSQKEFAKLLLRVCHLFQWGIFIFKILNDIGKMAAPQL